jgi:hypothetical protein
VRGEKVARMMIERDMLTSFTPKTWTIDGTPFRCSDDGYSLDHNILLEIKCMGKDAHAKLLEKPEVSSIPEHYRVQCIYNLGVSKAAKCIFASYREEEPDEAKKLIKVDVFPQPVEFERMKQMVTAFWKLVETDTPPAMTEADRADVTDDTALKASEAYVMVCDKIKELEAHKERLHEILIKNVSEAVPSITVGKINITRYEQKGTVDYSKVEALKHVNLDEYRKPASVRYKLTISSPKSTQ